MIREEVADIRLYKPYLGKASVQATPCTRGEYNKSRGWKLPADEDGSNPGYHVMYMYMGAPAHLTWLPKAVFEQIFEEASTDVGGGVVLPDHGQPVGRLDVFWPVEHLDGTDAQMLARANKGGYDLTFQEPVCMSHIGWMPKEMFESKFRRRSASKVHLETYVSHKRVQAGKILFMARDEVNDRLMLHLDSMANILPVAGAFLERHKPELGGYYVRYADGYESYSPAQAFEEGYKLVREGQDVSSN